MPFEIVRGNIAHMDVDAVVNAANKYLQEGGGVCGAIFSAAGSAELQAACDRLSPIETGQAVITPGFGLKAKYIIHAVGPVYNPADKQKCRNQLYSCYHESLRLASENGCGSIAFPLISSGIYGYPKAEALEVASRAITDFLAECEMHVYLMMFRVSDLEINRRLKESIDHYIKHNLTKDPDFPILAAMVAERYRLPGSGEDSLEDLIRDLDEPFNDTLLRLIRQKGMSEVEVYRKANMDRRLFSKIRTGGGYLPGKRTILALAIALGLDLDETNALLEKAGYTLSHSQVGDVIVEYFILHHKYDIFTINEALFAYDQPMLGGAS